FYLAYQERLKVLNAADFGDLLIETIRLFREQPEVLRQYQTRFKYILVDEYQDTNVAQYLWLRLLAQSSTAQRAPLASRPAGPVPSSLAGTLPSPPQRVEDARKRADAGEGTQTAAPSPQPFRASKNICCVGDDDQSIYGWRGAEVDNILRFEHDFPGAKV